VCLLLYREDMLQQTAARNYGNRYGNRVPRTLLSVMARNVVLNVGDFIIDRTWLVGEPSLAEQHNSRYDIPPRNMVEPEREPDVAGGIGTIARALAAVTSDLEILSVGAWSEYVYAEMRNRLLPPDFDRSIAQPSRLEFYRLFETKFTNLKSRFYLPDLHGARLTYRFDRNTNTVDEKHPPKPLKVDWPAPEDVRLIILGDYGYGVLHAPGMKERIGRYVDPPRSVRKTAGWRKPDVILRSFDSSVIEAYPWDLLTMNLHLFARYADREDFDPPVAKQVEGRCRYHPLLIEALEGCDAVRKHPGAAVLINLEEEGAIIVQDGKITPHILSAAGEGLNIGIGANDVVLAHIAKGLLTSTGTFEERLQAAAGDAVRAGSFFGARARQLDLTDGWYAPKLTVTADDISKSTPLFERKREPLPPRVDIVRALEIAVDEPRTTIQLHDGGWYLDGFLTVDSTLGAEIVALKAKIADYVRSHRVRPFVAVLCGDPGAGKTTLAQRLGEVTGCEVILENASQWASTEDLFTACERIRTARMRGRTPLAFIDEVDSEIHGQHVYGKLLAPIWDGSYFVQGQERTLGHPTVFLLAGSSDAWRDREALKTAPSKGKDKLPDLVSRFSANPINIGALSARKADIVYMTASHIIRKFPRVPAAQRGIFRLFTESTLRHGARSIAAVIDLFRQPHDQRWLATSDLAREDDLSLHIEKQPAKWRDDKLVIGIKP
jgi:hypothetical protein